MDWRRPLKRLNRFFSKAPANGLIYGNDQKKGASFEAPVMFNLGIDFGTRFTKVCYRDIASEKSGIIAFGAKVGDWRRAMVSSVMRIYSDGQLATDWLNGNDYSSHEILKEFDYLKLRLASLDPTFRNPTWTPSRILELDEIGTEAACAFFLARVITRARELVLQKEEERTRGREVQWLANVGVPVEYLDSPAIGRFRKVLAAAWILSNEAGCVSSIKFDQMKSIYRSLVSNLDIASSDCHAIPEIAAAVQSFVTSRRARPGMYVYFDIGGGTVDGVSFRYWRSNGEPRVSFYVGKVELLGVNALDGIVRSCTGRCIEELLLCRPCPHDLPPLETERQLIRGQVGYVVMKTRRKEPNAWRANGYYSCRATYLGAPVHQERLRMFIGGGGGGSGFYQTTIMSTYARNQHRNARIPTLCPGAPTLSCRF